MTFSPIVLGAGLSGYAFLDRTRADQQEILARSGNTARETAHFKQKLGEVQSADQLLDDRSLLRVALGAFGLDADIDNRAFIKQILVSDLTDTKSLANRLADKRYLEFARTFNFAGKQGPSLVGSKSAEQVTQDLSRIRTADDLFNDPPLLRATLASVGLEKDISNTYFIRQVLQSDPADPGSFARRLSDPRYADLARTFDLAGQQRDHHSIYGLATQVEGRLSDIRSVADVMEDPDLLAASLAIFGLQQDADRPDFIAAVLGSDPRDDTSIACQQDDPRYRALADAFGFVKRAEAEAEGSPFESKFEKLVSIVTARPTKIEAPADLFKDIPLMLAVFNFFDLPARPDAVPFANRLLNADPASATSLINVLPDPRYRAFVNGMGLTSQPAERTYPAGFAEGIVQNYLDRQFEARVGDTNPTMRLALALERDLGQAIEASKSNDARWYSVLASKPLRAVFEAVFQLPASFGTLDIDRQLSDFKTRAAQIFGTEQVADFAQPDRLSSLRRLYLVRSDVSAGMATAQGNSVLNLLAGARR